MSPRFDFCYIYVSQVIMATVWFLLLLAIFSQTAINGQEEPDEEPCKDEGLLGKLETDLETILARHQQLILGQQQLRRRIQECKSRPRPVTTGEQLHVFFWLCTFAQRIQLAIQLLRGPPTPYRVSLGRTLCGSIEAVSVVWHVTVCKSRKMRKKPEGQSSRSLCRLILTENIIPCVLIVYFVTADAPTTSTTTTRAGESDMVLQLIGLHVFHFKS